MAKTIEEAWNEERSSAVTTAVASDQKDRVKALKAEFKARFHKEHAMKHTTVQGWAAAKDLKDKYKRYLVPVSRLAVRL